MQIADFLAKFDNAKKTGDQWLVKCPSHKDRKASLAVKEGNDNRLLLHCHGGCETSAIVSALGLTDRDLFESGPPQKSTIAKTYDYIGLDGQVQYQVVRLEPKDFRQRRPDGSGGWIWNLQGVDRILYRLPELQGKPSIINCEGEKDADALHALGIPATTNCGGAGKWSEAYTASLKAAGVQRVAILPDNDPPGLAHAGIVAKSLLQIGIEPRVVVLPGLPAKGDVSDYLASGKGKDDLLGLIRTTAIWAAPPTATRVFARVDDGRYSLKINPEGIVLELDRLGVRHHETWAELSVSVNGSCPLAKSIDGILSSGDLNVSSISSRVSRSKILKDRSGNSDLDWEGYVEEICVKALKSEREGLPAIRFVDMVEGTETDDAIDVGDFPVLQEHPMAIFGDPGSAKSYFAAWIAGELAKSFPVLYADWELGGYSHLTRLKRLFQPLPRDLFHLRCTQPLIRESDRIRRLIKAEGIRFIVCDSIGPACFGRPEDAEHANAYIREVRAWNVGTLHLAHMSQRDSDEPEKNNQRIFGSVFWTANMRSIWFIKKAEDAPRGQIQFGLYHKKATFGELKKPLAYGLSFDHNRSRFIRTDVHDNDELASKLPLLDRMKTALSAGPLTIKALGEDLNLHVGVVRAMVSRHKKVFERLDDKKVRLAVANEERF